VVEQVEAFLIDHAVQVIRYTHSFVPGDPIIEDVLEAIATADKIVVFYSDAARRSEWVAREIAWAEELERAMYRHLLVYVVLRGEPLDPLQESRIVIPAAGRELGAVGRDLLRALYGPGGPPRSAYDVGRLL
jgi:hypothetical protein